MRAVDQFAVGRVVNNLRRGPPEALGLLPCAKVDDRNIVAEPVGDVKRLLGAHREQRRWLKSSGQRLNHLKFVASTTETLSVQAFVT